MAFFQATGVVSATPSTVLLTQLETMLTDHPAWEFVEEVVEGTYTERIWKCLGTLNSTGVDFFVCFMRLTTGIATNPILVKLAEQYDAGTNLASDYAPNPEVANTPDVTDGTVGTGALAWSSTTLSVLFTITTRTTSFNYMIQVTNDYVCVYASPMANPVYVGTYQSYWLSAYPTRERALIVTRVGLQDQDGGAAFTRQPGPGFAGVSTLDAFGGNTYATVTDVIGSVSTAGTVDPLANVMAVGAKILVRDALLRPRGELPDDLLVFGNTTGVVETDTIDLGTETYVFTSNFNNLTTFAVYLNTEI